MTQQSCDISNLRFVINTNSKYWKLDDWFIYIYWYLFSSHYITRARLSEDYFFGADFLIEEGFFVLGNSRDSPLLILAALFLWMTFVLAALSASFTAESILADVFCFLAVRTANSSLFLISRLMAAFFFELRRALLAVLVTGIGRFAPISNVQLSISN